MERIADQRRAEHETNLTAGHARFESRHLGGGDFIALLHIRSVDDDAGVEGQQRGQQEQGEAAFHLRLIFSYRIV